MAGKCCPMWHRPIATSSCSWLSSSESCVLHGSKGMAGQSCQAQGICHLSTCRCSGTRAVSRCVGRHLCPSWLCRSLGALTQPRSASLLGWQLQPTQPPRGVCTPLLPPAWQVQPPRRANQPYMSCAWRAQFAAIPQTWAHVGYGGLSKVRPALALLPTASLGAWQAGEMLQGKQRAK